MSQARAAALFSPAMAIAAGMSLALVGFALLPLPLAVVAALAFGALAYRRPDVALAAVLAALPTYYFPREIGGLALSLPESTLLLTAAACVARFVVRRELAPRPTPLDRWVLLFLAAA